MEFIVLFDGRCGAAAPIASPGGKVAQNMLKCEHILRRMRNGEMLDIARSLLQRKKHKISARIPPQSASLTAPHREEPMALPRQSESQTDRQTEI